MAEMEIVEKEDRIEILSKKVDLKITSDRSVWIRFPKFKQGDIDRSSNYQSLDKKAPEGLSKIEKIIWLRKLRLMVAEEMRYGEERVNQEETS